MMATRDETMGTRDKMDSEQNMDSEQTQPSRVMPSEEHPIATLKPGMIFGKYEILSKPTVGGMALVYKVEETSTGELRALKVMKPGKDFDNKAMDQFKREIDIVQKIVDERVVRFYGSFWEDDRLCLVMEYLPGKTLDKYIARMATRVSTVDALRLAGQMAVGLGAIHKRYVIHRDFKPGNIMVDDDLNLTIIDFGISKAGRFTTTLVGVIMATPSFMSPEQALAVKDIDCRTDIFNFGLIMYQLMSGRSALGDPINMTTAHNIFAHVLNHPIEPLTPEECVPALAAVIHKALQRDRDKRYRTATELAEALNEVVRDRRRKADNSLNTEERKRRHMRLVHSVTQTEKEIEQEKELDGWMEAANRALAAPDAAPAVNLPPPSEWLALDAPPQPARVTPQPAQVTRQPAQVTRQPESWQSTVPISEYAAPRQMMGVQQTETLELKAMPAQAPEWPLPVVQEKKKPQSVVTRTMFAAYVKRQQRQYWVVALVGATLVAGIAVSVTYSVMRFVATVESAPAATLPAATPLAATVSKPAGALPIATARKPAVLPTAVAEPSVTATASAQPAMAPTSTAEAAVPALAPPKRTTNWKWRPRPRKPGVDVWGDIDEPKKPARPTTTKKAPQPTPPPVGPIFRDHGF